METQNKGLWKRNEVSYMTKNRKMANKGLLKHFLPNFHRKVPYSISRKTEASLIRVFTAWNLFLYQILDRNVKTRFWLFITDFEKIEIQNWPQIFPFSHFAWFRDSRLSAEQKRKNDFLERKIMKMKILALLGLVTAKKYEFTVSFRGKYFFLNFFFNF